MSSTSTPPADFTHRSAGTAAATWHGSDRWAGTGEIVDLAAYGRVVVVAAHPDDETLGAAGLCARVAGAGVPLDVVVLTTGEASHPRSPTVDPAALAARRRLESEAALGVVAPGARLHQLDLGDGRLAESEHEVAVVLVRLLSEPAPAGLPSLVVAPWRHDGHPDHEAAGRAAAAAARRTDSELLEFPIWFWHWGTPEDAPWPDLRALTLTDAERRAKDAAIAEHRTQVAPLSDRAGDEVLLSPELLEHFRGAREVFVRQPAHDTALDDLHRAQDEPWHVDERWYERRKRDLTLALLPRARFRRVLEIGCSTGALAAALAPRCDDLVAIDSSAAAVRRAAARLDAAGHQHARAEVVAAPGEWVRGEFDLVVLSEVGYFLSPRDLDALRERIGASLSPDAVVLLCHWLHPVEGWPLDGATVHARLLGGLGLALLARYVDADVEMLLLGPDDARPQADR